MTLDERLQNVAVIGAAGKMGSGIGVLIAQEMAKLKLQKENRDKVYRLVLIDISEKALDGLRAYMRTQLTKVAEKSTVLLRKLYEDRDDLIENADIINTFVDDATSVLNFTTDIDVAKDAHLVFEAIVENEKIKIKIYKKLKKICSDTTFFLTNTSSIPISYLDDKAGLDGRLIGYHFYNPPVVQRLVEVISAKTTTEELRNLGQELGKRLRKKLVPSNDISGFIGNGHFMRDGLYAISEVERLKGKFRFPGAVYIMNRITQDFLIRPMGIFQLIDYVGIDVFQCILKVMRTHLGDKTLKSRVIDRLVKDGVLGGQYPDGSQKDGFLKYEKNRPVGIYNFRKKEYFMLNDKWRKKVDEKIGPLPEATLPWRALLGAPNREDLLKKHFASLKTMKTMGAELALDFLKKTKEIGEKLVSDGVANSADDVNAVLTNGFYWLYGPINNFL
ncbi:MAG TPA: 3-hydroxyacyl-CoA dehydrogenase family protein [candidate division WOR-3 bacterium]|uniref:3-hydroxyacyl-CoA dehydrogenase family protein n=1 Tax=candidate division WOR-3 bacterium TaxID=2052148 RepID=A0A9C9EP07_UNCW3|nr:3-hydroxyacyl-CoA dehydrogenase family protein [candidate division WOR-3 bacterium]